MKTRLLVAEKQASIVQDFKNLMYMMELSFSANTGSGNSEPAKVVQTEADMHQFMKGFG